MPRKLKIRAKEIQLARRDWYAFHFEKRTTFKNLSEGEQNTYRYAAMFISKPIMTIYGGLQESYPSRDEFCALARIQGLQDFDMANQWYVSDEGWQMFQNLWNQLGEPIDLWTEDAVQVDGTILFLQNEVELYPRLKT